MKELKASYPKDTLGYHYLHAKALFGENTAPVKFLEKKAEASARGWDELVIVPEEQIVHLLGEMFVNERDLK